MLQPGYRVLVKVVAFDGRHELPDKWEEDLNRMVDQQRNTGVRGQEGEREGQDKDFAGIFFFPSFFCQLMILRKKFLHLHRTL